MERNFTIRTEGLKKGTTLQFNQKLLSLLSLFLFICSVSNANNLLDIVVNSTDVSCPGSNDGTATVTAFNAWDPITYNWSNGGTTPTISGLAPGLYEVTVVDGDGSIDIGSTYVGEGDGIELYMSASYETCDGSDDASASVNASGGSGSYTYLWSTGETFVVASDLSAGTYTVTVTDSNGCSAVGSITVELSPEGVWLMTSSTNADCGLDNGTAHVSVMAGTAPFVINWSNGDSGEDISGLAPGTYTVSVTDANGCSNTEIVVIEADSDLNVSISKEDADCGVDNGSATVNVNGGSAPYVYEWSTGATTATITGLGAGTYSVTVSDAALCANVLFVEIDQDSGIDTDTNSTNATCNEDNGSATAFVNGGTAPFTYIWTTGATTATISDLAPGVYTVTATDANGCQDAETVEIFGTSVDGGTITTNDELIICSGDGIDDIVTVSVSGSSGDNSRWVITNPAGDIIGFSLTNEFNFDGAGTGNCVIWYLKYEDGLDGLEIGNNVSELDGCYDFSNSITVIRTDPDGGSISTNDPTNVCVGDGENDFVNVTLSGEEGPNTSWIITDESLNILDLPGNSPFNFEGAGVGTCLIWSITYADGLDGLVVGANAADLSGCYELSNSISVVRQECCDIDGGDISTNDPTNVCVGDGVDDFVNVSLSGATGSNQGWLITDEAGNILELPMSPPFNFEGAGTGTCLIWSISYEPGLTGLDQGSNVSGLMGCYALSSSSIAVERNSGPSVSLSGIDVTCANGTNGSVSASASGGDGNYSYNWSTGASSATITGLSAGIYSVTVTDGNGCSSSESTTISEPDALTLNTSGNDESCIGAMDGSATATVGGGTPPYSYDWSNGGTTATINNLGTGSYSVIVTDANGCTIASTSDVVVNTNGITSCSAMISSSYNEGVEISTFGGNDGSASTDVNGGSLPYSYLWSDGQTGAEATNLSAGTYSVIITDAGGCSCSSEVTLVDPSKVGNFVWEDINKDGIQNPGEPGIGGVTVNLIGTADNGASITRTVNTASDGTYCFDGLLTGNYKVTFNKPSGYAVSPEDAGGNDSTDSDMDPDTGMTDFFDLGPSELNPTIDAGLYQCVSIGDFVFYDGNRDGIQQPWEAGYADAQVILKTAGPDGIFCNADDVFIDAQYTGNDGKYLFECVDPGQYYLQFGVNTGEYMYTDQNQGSDDELDSDVNADGKTAPFTVTQGMADDLSFDAGIYLICDDFTSGGQIGYDQDICPGEFPNTLVSITLPSGGYGASEYIWLKSTTGGPIGGGSWTEIPNSDSPTYDPPQLYQTTFFIRCARRENCDNYVAESNAIVIVVGTCIGGQMQNLTALVQGQTSVSVDWTTSPEDQLYRYTIERSPDGVNFTNIGSVNGLGNQQTTNYYNFMDYSPRIGRNIYRVMREDLSSGLMLYSDNVEAMFNVEESRFFVYPNPTSGTLFVESLYNMNGNASIELFNATGQLLDVIQVDYTLGKVDFDFNKYASGPYFIRISYDDRDDTDLIKVIKE